MKITNLLFVLVLLLFSCNQNEDLSSSSFSIFRTGGRYFIENNVSHKIVKKSENFNEIFDFVIGELKIDGGKILIRAGRYEVTSPLRLISNIQIEGEGIATGLYVSDHFDGGDAVFIADTVNDVTIRNLSVKQLNDKENITGIIYNHCGTSKIIDINAIGLTGYGVCLINSSFLCEISGSTFGKIKNSAVLLQNLGKGRAGDWVPNQVSDCIVYTSGIGIEIDASIVINVVDCQVFQTKSHAYYIHNQSNSVLVSGCRSYQIQDAAIKVVSSNELNVSSNIFCWSGKEGIVMDNVSWATVSSNEFIDNGSFNPMDSTNIEFNLNGKTRPPNVRQQLDEIEKAGYFSGVKLQNNCRGIVVSSNAIFNWPAAHPMRYGIEENETCHHNQFFANNINYCESGDILSEGKASKIFGNVALLPLPHSGNMKTMDKNNRLIQGFDLRLMDFYIKQQLK